jgi:hypothetical protein
MADASRKLEIVIEGDDRTKGTMGGLSKSLAGLGKFAGGALLTGAAAAAAGVAGLAVGLGASVKEAMSAQEIQAQLNAVLKSTGGVAGMTADEVNNLADELSQITRFEDEAVISAENMLLTFTNIGEDVFPAATETVLDMSQALGQDLQSSAMQLGKALNDPVQGVTALRRVGVQLTDEQENLIKSLMEVGDVSGAQAIILAELKKEFGGSAVAAGKTFGGQIDRLKNTLGNVGETIGNALLPSIQILADKFLSFVQSDQFQAWIAKIADWLANKLPPAIAAASAWITGTLIPAVVAMAKWIGENVLPVLQKVWEWLATNLPPAIAALSAFWQNTLLPAITAVWKFLSENVIPILQAIWDWFSTTIPAALNTLKAAWESNFMGIRTLFEGAMNHIKLVFALFRAAFEGDWHKFGEILRQIVENLKTTLVNIFKGIWDTIKNIDWLGLGKAIIQGIGNGIMAMGKWLIDTLVNVAKAAYEAARGFLEAKSPSGLFTDLGITIPQGLAKGINKLSSMPAMAASGMASAMVPATVSALPSGAAGGGVNNYYITVPYSPTIGTASRAQLEAELVPLIDRALRSVERRK